MPLLNPDEFYAMATQNGEEEAEKFYRNAKQYIEITKLTPELLRVFIRRIEVYEKFEKYSRTAGNPIRIHYAFRLPEQDGIPAIEVLAQTTAKTA